MNIILFGMPGAGKGTQAELLVERNGFSTISTGNLLRKVATSDTPFGKEIQDVLASGQLVSDNIILTLIADELHNIKNAIFDGFPRTIAQAEALQKEVTIDLVIIFEINEAILAETITGRRVHEPSGRVYHIKNKPPVIEGLDDETGEPLIQRTDDKLETLQKRLSTYREQTFPIISFYEEQNSTMDLPKLLRVDASLPPEEIYKQISLLVKND